MWDLDKDEFVFSFEKILDVAKSLPPSKRNILKIAATFFDPLGFIYPITARVKSIFQLLCKDKRDWDSNVSSDMLSIWKTFLSDIERFGGLRVKRFAFVEPSENIESITLHGFCDSSETCYAAVLYLQIKTSTGIKVKFVSAKTKVAPLKELSIARLELLGCILLNACEGGASFDGIKCWSDSQVALCWLKGRNKCWKPWVENRVVKVRKVIGSDDWFFILGKENPAVIPTRICEASDLQRWLTGPEFFTNGFYWEVSFDVDEKLQDADVLVESKKAASKLQILHVTNEASSRISSLIDCSRFSTLNKLLNTTALVLRFVKILKNRIKSEGSHDEETITAEEKENALEIWIKDEQTRLQRQPNFSKINESLKLFEDQHGVQRLKGRFGSSSLEYEVKHPTLIPSGERVLTKLIPTIPYTLTFRALPRV